MTFNLAAPFYRTRSGKPQRLRYTALNGTSSSARSRQPPEPESSIRVPGRLPVTRMHRDSSRCLARALAPPVCDTPLLRADVTRLDSLGEAPPLEDEGPLSGCHLLTQDSCDARQVLREVQRLGQDVRQLRRSRDADKLHVAILDDLMGKVFPDVNVLGAFPSASDIVPPFDTCRIILVHRSAKPMRSRRLRR